MKKLVTLVAIALVAVLATSVAFAQEDEIVYEPDEEVIIGFAAGLSGEGIAPLGIDIQRGVELANEARPAVTIGETEFEVALDIQDALCSAEGGQTVANRFTADANIAGVVGHMCSSSCAAAAPIYDTAGYTTISPSCTAPDLTTSGFTSFNRSTATDQQQGQLAANFIYNELGLTRLATIHDGSPYGEGLVSVVAETFEELGGEVVAQDAVTVGDTDFRALLEDFANEDPEIIYFGGFPAEGARIIQQLPDAGLEDITFMGADGIQGAEVIELAGDAAEGVYASAPVPTGEGYDAFLETYEETYNETPPAPFHANGHDAYNILLDAIEATGSLDDDGNLVLSREAIRDYVRSVDGSTGLIGTFVADGNGELVDGGYSFFVVEDGEFVRLEMDEMMEDEEAESEDS